MIRVSQRPEKRAAAVAYWARTHGPSILARAYDRRAAQDETPDTVAELLDAAAEMVRDQLDRSGAAPLALARLKGRDEARREARRQKKRRASEAAARAGNVIPFPTRGRRR